MRETLEDVRKKYRDTFCFLDLNGKQYLTEFYDDNGEDTCYFRSPKFGEILLDLDTVHTCLTFKFPKNGLYNINGQAFRFFRVPERQWKRAPCRDNSKLTSLLSAIDIFITGIDTDITLHNLEELYKENYPKSLDEALASVKLSLAVNKDFAVSISNTGDKNEAILWFHSQPIGLINIKERLIEIQFEPLYQETKDFLKTQESLWLLTKKQQS